MCSPSLRGDLLAPAARPESVGNELFQDVRNVANKQGVSKQPGITRRDPSDIIKVGDTYFVYYTRVDHGKLPTDRKRLRISGYVGTIWYATSRNEGRNWIEQGSALETGASGSFDSFAVFTPNIVTFDGRYWLYYKGRNIDHGPSGPARTQMGLAIAETPAGPYVRVNDGKPILPNSHKVMIWPHRTGVAAFASASRTLEFAPDGIDFTSNPLHIPTSAKPIAPGCFRTDLVSPEDVGRGIAWGICMRDPGGPSPYLLRYTIDLAAHRCEYLGRRK